MTDKGEYCKLFRLPATGYRLPATGSLLPLHSPKKKRGPFGPRPVNDKGREGLVDQNAMFLAQYASICCTSAGGNGT